MTYKIDIDELVSDQRTGMTLTALSKKYGCSIQVIGRRLTAAGVDYPKTNAKLLGRENEIISLYQKGVSATDLGNHYGVSNVTILNIMERKGVARRSIHDATIKYPFNENYFDKIDTEEKAYILGFLYADGCNHRDGFSVGLNQRDRETVVKIAAALETKRPIYCINNTSYIRISSKYVSDQLTRLGCPPAKSMILTFPTTDQVPQHLIHHFVRGYFDGDGCIHVRKNSQNMVIHIIGTEDFVRGIRAVSPCEGSIKKRNGNNIWFYGLYATKNVLSFYYWIYRDASIWMERKRNKFIVPDHGSF